MSVSISLYIFNCLPVLILRIILYRMPIIDKFKDMGTVVMGKVESGSIREGDSLIVMPNKVFSKRLLSYDYM